MRHFISVSLPYQWRHFKKYSSILWHCSQRSYPSCWRRVIFNAFTCSADLLSVALSYALSCHTVYHIHSLRYGIYYLHISSTLFLYAFVSISFPLSAQVSASLTASFVLSAVRFRHATLYSYCCCRYNVLSRKNIYFVLFFVLTCICLYTQWATVTIAGSILALKSFLQLLCAVCCKSFIFFLFVSYITCDCFVCCLY